ncbi:MULTISPECIES: hypothetical protein, partial [Mesorhizobium]
TAGELAMLDGGDAGRVITAILKPLQRIDYERRNLRVADDSNDTAHADSPRFPMENQRYLGMAGLP